MTTPSAGLILLLPILAACGLFDGTASGPEILVPHFRADDPRVDTAGFVAETLRLHVERDGVRHTLLAFAVGDTLTLGAMVRGTFRGMVQWRVGGRTLQFPFATDGALSDVPVQRSDAPGSGLRGQGASFRGTTWVNLELPLREWLGDAGSLQLAFFPEVGTPRFLPDDGFHYRARLVTAP